MVLNYYNKFKRDLKSLTKKELSKLFSIHFAYLVLILFFGMFFFSAMLAYFVPIDQHTDFLYSLKQTYQVTGEITPEEGSNLLAFNDTFNRVIYSSSLILIAFLIICSLLKSLKDLFVEKILFKKKIPKKLFIDMLISNFISVLIIVVIMSLLFYFTNLIVALILSFLLIIILESLIFVRATHYLHSKKKIMQLWFEHVIFNLVLTGLFIVGFFVIVLITRLFLLINVYLGQVIFILLLILLYIKREVVLFTTNKYLKGR